MITDARRSRRKASYEADLVSDLSHNDADIKEDKAVHPRDAMKKIGPEDLRRVFRQYDVDGSGELSADELITVLVSIIGKLPSDEAVRTILQDIDVDGSGSIDEDEFLEFFAKVDNLNQLQEQLEMMGKRSGFTRKIATCYFSVNFVAFCGFCLVDISAKPGSLEGRLGRIGLMASGFGLAFTILIGILAPIVRYKCGSQIDKFYQQAKETIQPRGIFDRRRAVLLQIADGKLTKEQQLARQADGAHENLPRPSKDSHPVTPDLGPSRVPESWQSYRRSVRNGVPDWPAQPLTPAPYDREKVGTPSVVKVGNNTTSSHFTGYHLDNYQRSREIMARTSNKSFTPTAMSKAERVPWFSAEASEQIQEAQPDLWNSSPATRSPATTTLPSPSPLSPSIRNVPHMPDLHLQTHALALRDVLPPKKATKLVPV